MQKLNLKWLFLLLGLVALIVAVSFPRDTTAQAKQDCLSEPSEVIATVNAKGNSYRLYRPITLDVHGEIDTLIMENSQGICVRLNDESDATIRPLSSYTDSTIALELNKQKWQRTIKAQGGVEKFQQGFNQFATTEKKHYMPSDAYESLKALGVVIPKNVHPYDEPPADIPEIRHEPVESKPKS